MKSQLIGKDPDAGKDGRQEEKGMTEYKMIEWHHQLGGHEFGREMRRCRSRNKSARQGEVKKSLEKGSVARWCP